MQMRHVSRIVRVTLVFLLLAWLPGCANVGVRNDAPAPACLTVLFFNDLHGHLKPFEVKTDQGSQEVGGIARMAYLIRGIREENDRRHVRTVVLMAGDVLQGTPMSTVFQGEPDVKCLNAVGLDAATVGNHEFDFGLDNFLRLKRQADFPFLSANIVTKGQGAPLCRPYQTIPLGEGLSLTVIGVTTRELLTTTQADNVASLDVLDPVASVRQAYDKVKSSGPVILLSHSSHDTDRKIAESLPGLAAIIGGHDQILLSPYRKVGDVPVFQAFEKGRYLGRIDLEVDTATGKARLTGNSYIPIVAGMPGDPRIAEIVADYDRRLGDRFKEVIGRSDTFLDGERERIRYEETTLGNFVADIMTSHTGARIAFINAGALRASIRPGPVTVEDVFKAMPYANELVTTELTGREIEEVLARAVRGAREDDRRAISAWARKGGPSMHKPSTPWPSPTSCPRGVTATPCSSARSTSGQGCR
jgi:2',3'-cyclic-nucleotide 2'-phosphodiesterase (5'-nucleotidase family)